MSQPTDRGDAFGWELAGRDAWKSGALDLAAEAFENAIRLESNPIELSNLYDLLGHVHWDQRRLDDAIEAFRVSIFHDGTASGPWHDIAQIRLMQKDPAAAAELLREAIRRKPDRAKYWNTLGVAQIRLGHLDDAVTSLESHVQLDSHSAGGWANLGLAYCKLGRYAEARSACEKALEIGPPTADVWITLGSCHAAVGDWAAAVAAFRKAVDLDPRDAAAWYNVTAAEANAGRLDQARRAFGRLEELDPKQAAELREQLTAAGTDLEKGFES
jgi:superkiller protein 3